MNMNQFKSKYGIDDLVYLVTDSSCLRQIISVKFQISQGKNYGVSYLVMNGTTESWHYENELTYEKTNINI